MWTVLVALLIGALSFVYRFNTLSGPLAGFDNDHFFQIVRSDAMLDGELPLRDYSDTELRSLWPPLSYATSAAAMKAMGRSLRSEAIMSVGMLSLGAAALFWAAAVIAGGILPAALATLLAIGLSPTLYNYPKIVPYAFAVIAMLAYARKPNVWRLLVSSAIVAIAALYRHDHGVYLGISSAVLILLVHGRRAARPLTACAAFVIVGLMPGLVFAQQHGGLVAYLRDCLTLSRREIGRTAAPAAPFQIDLSQPLLARVPPPASPQPRIAVRWAATVTPEGRARAEQELGLTEPERRGDDLNWSYEIDGPSPSRLATIVQDPRVADTDGFDRQTFALNAVPPPPLPRGGLFGWRILPGILNEGNAVLWLRLVAWSVTVASIACLAWPPLRRAVAQPDVPSGVVAAVGVLGIVLCLVFLRNPAAYRLPDVAVPVSVLGAWLLTALPRAARSRPHPVRALVAMLFALTIGLTILSVGMVGTVPERIVEMSGADRKDVRGQWLEVWKTLGEPPESMSGVDETLQSAASYLRRCSLSSDRLLVTDYVPELYYFSRRGVAAGQLVYFGGFYTPVAAQRKTMEHWARQSVPIVLTQPPERFDDEFGSDYPELADYLRAHYRRAGDLEVRRGTRLDVWVAADRDGTTDPDSGLPCFGPAGL